MIPQQQAANARYPLVLPAPWSGHYGALAMKAKAEIAAQRRSDLRHVAAELRALLKGERTRDLETDLATFLAELEAMADGS